MNDYRFGNFIYELRTEKGLSQSELGKILGVSNKAVSKWETGEAKPRSGKLALLAETLGVTVEELLCGKREKSNAEQGEEIAFAIEMFAREYRRARKELLVFCILFFSTPLLMLLIIGIAWARGEVTSSGEIFAAWVVAPLAVCAVLHVASEAGVIITFLLTVKRRRLLYASFPDRREEVSARTHTVPPAKKTGKLGLIILIGIILMAIAVTVVLCALGIWDGTAAEFVVGGCVLAFGIGNIVFTRLWLKRIDKHMKAHAFEHAIKDAKFLLEVWLPDGRSEICDALRLNIAVAYFALRDDGNFRDYLGEITTRRFSFGKSFWKCVDAFAQGDREVFRAEYAELLSLTEKTDKRTAQTAAFYGECARLLSDLVEGNAAAKASLLPLFTIPRLLELIEAWKV